MRRLSTVVLATGVLVVLVGAPAAGHAGIMPGRIAPDTTETAELVLAHGCGEDGTVPGDGDPTFATTSVTLDVPVGVGVAPLAVDGWLWATETDERGEVVRVRWDSVDPAGAPATVSLGLDVSAPDLPAGTELWLPVLQDCTDGQRMAWANEGMEPADGAHPATRLVIAGLPHVESGGGGLSMTVVMTIALALGVVAGGIVFVLSGRRD